MVGSNSNNNNFFTNHLNGTTNGSHNGVGNEFVADFRKASIYNSNNSLNSTGSGNSGHQVNGKITNGISETMTSNNGDLNANFADFENNNCIYNAAGESYLRENVRIIQVKTFFLPLSLSTILLCLSWDQFYFLV